MILDANGRPLRRAIGFIGGFVVVSEILPAVETSVLVGGSMELEKGDAARTQERVRRLETISPCGR